MSSISVNTTKVLREQSSLQSYQKKVNRIADSVENVRLNLSFDLQSRDRIVKSLSSTESLLEVCGNDLSSMESVLGEVMARYQETEERVKERSGQLVKSEITEADTITITTGSLESGETTDSEDDTLSWFLSLIKSFLTYQDKYEDDKTSGAVKALVSYFQKLSAFATGDKEGWTGLSDWCDLGEASSKLWKASYSYLKTYYPWLKDQMGEAAAGVGIAGSLFGLAGGVSDMADTISSEDSTTGEKIASVLDAQSEGIDVVKSVYEYQHLADKSTGLYTAAGLWATFAETITNSASQLVTSISTYSADGSWDWGDTGATGVEIAVSGLSAMISGLTFGIISPETFGTTTEDISSAIENWAEGVGAWIGEKMCS